MAINVPAVSKINWTQVVAAAGMLTAVFGLDITPETQVKIVAGIGVGAQFLTVVWRTFFTDKTSA